MKTHQNIPSLAAWLVRLTCLGLMTLLLQPRALANNYVIDGSFEHLQSMGWQIDPSLGWSPVANGIGANPSLITASSYAGSAAAIDGNFFVALQAPSAGIYQQVNGLTVGQTYALSFLLGEWCRVDPSGLSYTFQYGSKVNLNLSGAATLDSLLSTPYSSVAIESGANPPQPYTLGHWNLEQVYFTALSSSLTIRFQDPFSDYSHGWNSNNPGIESVTLDAVSTSKVPDEGSVLSLLAAALPMIALLARRSVRRP